jgi:hypothetical protein
MMNHEIQRCYPPFVLTEVHERLQNLAMEMGSTTVLVQQTVSWGLMLLNGLDLTVSERKTNSQPFWVAMWVPVGL